MVVIEEPAFPLSPLSAFFSGGTEIPGEFSAPIEISSFGVSSGIPTLSSLYAAAPSIVYTSEGFSGEEESPSTTVPSFASII
ncbi:hypothetical protein [uncultured Dubosiella sp.]|uniref:hypothetical protein n=1 Tax=uncultured Dubosiella sp. TaxID=1937011 RepID=UPI0025B3FED8|nr:hypothetical protein [uncultured Dubosiella sp.]